MPKKLPDLQVLIPYKDLCSLLQSAEDVESLKKDNQNLHDQMGALHYMFTELMEKFREL